MGDSLEFDQVDWITAGAVGEPGERTFYLQARQGDRLVALLMEKGQVQALAELAQELLGRMGVVVTPDDLDEAAQRLVEPVEALWRAGSLGLGLEADSERFVLEAEEAEEAEEAAGTARFWMTRDQLLALAAYAAYAVEAGARERCSYCSRPMDPDGHVCPAMNGHGRLSV